MVTRKSPRPSPWLHRIQPGPVAFQRYTRIRSDFAEELLAITPGNGDRCVYLGHAGSDANDVALRACRLASGKRKVVAFAHGYHGGIGLAMEVSGVHISAGNAADPDLYPQLIQIHSEPMMKALRQSAQAFTKLKNSSIKVMWLV